MTSRYRKVHEEGELLVLQNNNDKYAVLKVIDIKDDTRGDANDELTFEYYIQIDGSNNFSDVQEINSIGVVSISGDAISGMILSASNTLSDPDGINVITYTWTDGVSTLGTGETYMLTDASLGNYHIGYIA